MGWFRRTPTQAAPAETRATQTGTTGIKPPARDTSPTITVETALGIGAVYRSVMILVTAAAQMDLGVFRNGVQIPTPGLIKAPNVNDHRQAFIEETVYSLATWGNAYWMLHRAGPGESVDSITVLDPEAVGVDLDLRTGKVTYSYLGAEVPRWRIKHLKLMRRPGKPLGLGPIQAAKGELSGALRLRQFADTWFDTAGVPTGALTTDMTLSPEESREYAAAWKKFLADNDGIAVLSRGLKYDAVHIDPKQATFVEVQAASTTAIARLFGVPSTYLLTDQGGTSNTYVNAQELGLRFLQTTLTRYCNEIELALTDLLPRGQSVRFNEDDLLRMDTKTLWEVRKVQLDTGARTVNEVRAEDHREPVAWGDERPAALAAAATDQGAADAA